MGAERDITDPALDELLRAHSSATPSRTIDDAILAAAHRAVDSRPRPDRGWRAWHVWMPVAAAAAIGFVVVGVAPLAPPIDDPTVAGDRGPPASAKSVAPMPSVGTPDVARSKAVDGVPLAKSSAETPAGSSADGRESAASANETPAATSANGRRSAPPANETAASANGNVAAPSPDEATASANGRGAAPPASRTPAAPLLKSMPTAKIERERSDDARASAAGGTARQQASAAAPRAPGLPADASIADTQAPVVQSPRERRAHSTAPSAADGAAAGSLQKRDAFASPSATNDAPSSTPRAERTPQSMLPQVERGALRSTQPQLDPEELRSTPPQTETRGSRAPASALGAAAPGQDRALAEAPAALRDSAGLSAERAPQESTARSLDAWIARLRALKEAGNRDDAIRELARFRAEFADADARLPDDVRQWARTLR